MNKRRFMIATATLALGTALGPPALADDAYPNQPIRVVMPWAPGGPTDVIGRVVANEMSAILGQPLVIESRPGASGSIGTGTVAKATPDGYTLVMNASVQVIYPAQFKSLNFDPINDFTTVGIMGTVPMVAIVPENSSYKSFKDVIDFAKANPGKLTFASPGIATLPHLVGELVNNTTGAKITHIGYRGSSPALTDVAGGHVDLMYAPLAPAVPLIRSGKVRALAVSTKNRVADLPDVPTIAETVVPDFDIVTWYGMWAPKDTPEAIVKKLNDAMVKASSSPKVVEALQAQGTIPNSMDYKQAHAFALEESQRWIGVMKDANIQPE